MNEQSIKQFAGVLDRLFESARRPAPAKQLVYCYVMDARSHRCIASAGFSDFISNRWPWVQQVVAGQFACRPDDVSCVETDDGDKITVRGEIVAYLGD